MRYFTTTNSNDLQRCIVNSEQQEAEKEKELKPESASREGFCGDLREIFWTSFQVVFAGFFLVDVHFLGLLKFSLEQTR